MKKVLSIILIATGLIVIAIPIVGRIYHDYRQGIIMRKLEAVFSLKDNVSGEDQFASYPPDSDGLDASDNGLDNAGPSTTNASDTAIVPSTGNTDNTASESEAALNTTNSIIIDDYYIIGIIEIPKINLQCPIVEGVEQNHLAVGIGHFPGTAPLGRKGNTALAGHRSYTFGTFFNRIDELEADDIIIIKTSKDTFTYSVEKKFLVDPYDVSILKKPDESKAIITLITCHPVYNPTHRLVIQGHIV